MDVEFKLFGKFTIKQFVIIGSGIGFGSLFIMMASNGSIPTILGFILFGIFSGIGLGLGMMRVNDQGMDSYIRNFITAIRNPTIRVWKNKDFDDKVESMAASRGLQPIVDSVSTVDSDKKTGNKIVGVDVHHVEEGTGERTGDKADEKQDHPAMDDQVSEDVAGSASTSGTTPADSASTAPQEPATPVGSTASSSAHIVSPVSQANRSQVGQTPPASDTTFAPQADNLLKPSPIGPSAQGATQVDITKNTAASQVNRPQVGQTHMARSSKVTGEVVLRDRPTSPTENKTPSVRITPETFHAYAVEASNFSPDTNTVNLLLLDQDDTPVPKVLAVVKKQSRPVMALLSDENGLILSSKKLQNGEYTVLLKHDEKNFPDVIYDMEDKNYPIIKIKETS